MYSTLYMGPNIESKHANKKMNLVHQNWTMLLITQKITKGQLFLLYGT